MHTHGCPSEGKNSQDTLFYMQGEGILFLGFAFHDLHSLPRTSNWNEEVTRHNQKALEDQNTDHEYLLITMK